MEHDEIYMATPPLNYDLLNQLLHGQNCSLSQLSSAKYLYWLESGNNAESTETEIKTRQVKRQSKDRTNNRYARIKINESWISLPLSSLVILRMCKNTLRLSSLQSR